MEVIFIITIAIRVQSDIIIMNVLTCRALQRRWMEDTKREHDAFNVRRQSEENVVLRKMYRGLLSKMHEWNADEQSDLR